MQTETSQCRHGPMTYLPNDRFIGRSLQIYGEYCEHEVEMLRHLLRPGDMAIDAGANIGALTVGMAQAVGPQGAVHAFEPQGVLHGLMAENIAQNRLANVVAHKAAAGAAPGVIRVPPLDYGEAANFGGVALGMSSGDGEEVPVVTIDSLRLPRLRGSGVRRGERFPVASSQGRLAAGHWRRSWQTAPVFHAARRRFVLRWCFA